jgi:hypothetical protein
VVARALARGDILLHSNAATAKQLQLHLPAVTQGNRIIVGAHDAPTGGVLSHPPRPVLTITDSIESTYGRDASVDYTENGGLPCLTVVDSSVVAAGGDLTITVTSSAMSFLSMAVAEYRGLQNGDPPTDVIEVGSAQHTSTFTSGPSSPTSVSDGLAVMVFGDGGFVTSLAPGEGWTLRARHQQDSAGQILLADQDSGAPGLTVTGTVTASQVQDGSVLVVVYRPQ